MNKAIYLIILLFTHTLLYSQDYNLTVKVEGLKNFKGDILFGLYNNDSNFPEKETAFAGKILPINSKNSKYTFTRLKKGNYAVAIIHDENKDGELNTNFMGIPKEGFGFSNNVIGMFGPPAFEKASVLLDKDKTITIMLRN